MAQAPRADAAGGCGPAGDHAKSSLDDGARATGLQRAHPRTAGGRAARRQGAAPDERSRRRQRYLVDLASRQARPEAPDRRGRESHRQESGLSRAAGSDGARAGPWEGMALSSNPALALAFWRRWATPV